MTAVSLQKPSKVFQRPLDLENSWSHGGVTCHARCKAPTEVDFKNPGAYRFEGGASAFAHQLGKDLEKHSIENAFYLNVTEMNAKRIFDPVKELSTITTLPNHIRTKVRSDVGVAAEVVPLIPRGKETHITLNAGCGSCVALADGAAVSFHAGAKSVIDFERVRTGRKSREYESVFHAVAAQFDEWQIPRHLIRIRINFVILAKAYKLLLDHENAELAETHRKILKELSDKDLTRDVMKPDGSFSIPGMGNYYRKLLRFAEVSSVSPLPVIGRFASTRHPDPRFRNVRNTSWITVELQK